MKLKITPSDILNLISQVAARQPINDRSAAMILKKSHEQVEKYLNIKIDFEISSNPVEYYCPPEGLP